MCRNVAVHRLRRAAGYFFEMADPKAGATLLLVWRSKWVCPTYYPAVDKNEENYPAVDNKTRRKK